MKIKCATCHYCHYSEDAARRCKRDAAQEAAKSVARDANSRARQQAQAVDGVGGTQ